MYWRLLSPTVMGVTAGIIEWSLITIDANPTLGAGYV
jgi:hypothetical protein